MIYISRNLKKKKRYVLFPKLSRTRTLKKKVVFLYLLLITKYSIFIFSLVNDMVLFVTGMRLILPCYFKCVEKVITINLFIPPTVAEQGQKRNWVKLS